jgi:hypothetical protein
MYLSLNYCATCSHFLLLNYLLVWFGKERKSDKLTVTTFTYCSSYLFSAYIQRRGSILAWIVILSVHSADTIAEASY